MRIARWGARVVRAAIFAACVGSLPAQKPASCPDAKPWYGKVQIWTFGFEFTIPKGLKGYWNSAACSDQGQDGCSCMGDHGRLIPLRTGPDKMDRQIEMYADLGAELDDDFTLSGAVRSHLSMDDHGARRRAIENRQVVLAGNPARRVVLRYVDQKNGRWMVEDSIISVTHKRPAEYVLYLRTPAKYYARDKIVFEAMIRTFRWTPGEYGPA